MLAYLFILLTVSLNATRGYCSKKLSGMMQCLCDNIDLSIIRSGACACIGGILLLATKGKSGFALDGTGFAICLLSAVVGTVNYIVWVSSLKGDVYMLVSASNSAGFLIPMIAGLLIFGEHFTPWNAVSLVFILIAFFFLFKYNMSFHGKLSVCGIALLALLFLTSGLSSLSQKMFVTYVPEMTAQTYTFYTFFFSTLLASLVRIFIKHPGGHANEKKNIASMIPFGAFMGLALYGATYFQTLAAALMDALLLYPLSNAMSLCAGCIMAWIFFHEKPSRDSIIGAVFVFAGLVCSRF